MQLSASFCRTQQALHDERASSAQLDNVRAVAGLAAAAWGHEAEIADMREKRRLRVQLAEEGAVSADEFEDEDSVIFSENPDRGLPQR